MSFRAVTDEESKEKKSEEEVPPMPQLSVVIENMELIVPKSSVDKDYIKGSLARLIVSNDVLDKEDNTRMTVSVDAKIATRFERINNEKLYHYSLSHLSRLH